MLLPDTEIHATTRCRPCVSKALTAMKAHLLPLCLQCRGRMSSLVTYEDSESDDESVDHVEEGASVSIQRGSCEQHRDAVVRSSSEVASFNPAPDWTLLENNGKDSEPNRSPLPQPQSKYSSYRTVQDMDFRNTTAVSFASTDGKILPLQTPPYGSQSFSDGLHTAKRQHSLPSGVRPYIPKRQRLAASVETMEAKSLPEQVSGNQMKESHIFSEVSETVKPYLSHKPCAAGIPRRLLMSLGGHQGPVNTMQWCPVPHLSHLLLSASMDKTFKVTIWLTLLTKL